MKEKMNFTNIEVMFIIVMITLVIVLGITFFAFITQSQNITNFKKDTNNLVVIAKNSYQSFLKMGKTEYIVNSNDANSKGMCITINGLKENDFITKEYKDWDGYIVIEEVGDNKFHYSVWVENKKYVVDGYDSEMVEQLKINKGITKYNNESFSSNVKETFTGTSGDKGGPGSLDGSSLKRYAHACIDEKI